MCAIFPSHNVQWCLHFCHVCALWKRRQHIQEVKVLDEFNEWTSMLFCFRLSVGPLIQFSVLTCLTVHQDVQHRLACDQLQIRGLLRRFPPVAKVKKMSKAIFRPVEIINLVGACRSQGLYEIQTRDLAPLVWERKLGRLLPTGSAQMFKSSRPSSLFYSWGMWILPDRTSEKTLLSKLSPQGPQSHLPWLGHFIFAIIFLYSQLTSISYLFEFKSDLILTMNHLRKFLIMTVLEVFYL